MPGIGVPFNGPKGIKGFTGPAGDPGINAHDGTNGIPGLKGIRGDICIPVPSKITWCTPLLR